MFVTEIGLPYQSSTNVAIFMHSGRPKAHDIFAQNDSMKAFSLSLFRRGPHYVATFRNLTKNVVFH
jgi:hypothetical protein